MARRILVTGGRENYDWMTVERAIFDHCKQGDIVVHGAAGGIDSLCSQLVRYNPDFFDEDPFPAEWKIDGVFQPNAGFERNQAMVDSGVQGALVFAGGSGTADCFRRIKEAGIKFYDYQNYWMGQPRS
jgi:hypothetical protein